MKTAPHDRYAADLFCRRIRAEYSSISKAVRALQVLRPTEAEFTRFKERLVYYIAAVEHARKTSNSGWLVYGQHSLTQIPIVKPPAELKERLDTLVMRRMAGDASVEAEIDAVVYGLYGLGEEEVRVVEGR